MVATIEWTAPSVADGVVERSFRLHRPTGTVPGMLWLPTTPGAPPRTVLLGHGGSGHKASARIAALAHWFASRAGLAALAIDGPYHGDRVPAPLAAADYQARIAAEGIDVVLDRMTDDWLATVDALGSTGVLDAGDLGYLGLSMGTRFGLPLAVALADRMRCVVLGKFGLRQGPGLHPGLASPQRIAADARRITAPALYHVQQQDDVFPFDGQRELFDLLGSPDKHLISYPGAHTDTPPAAIALWREFVAGHLSPG